MAKATISKKQFNALKSKLKDELLVELEEEVDLGDLGDEESDLWDTPAVDSKAVVNVSPTVEKHTGSKLDPAWIKCGGYDSIPEAVDHIIEQIELNLEFK